MIKPLPLHEQTISEIVFWTVAWVHRSQSITSKKINRICLQLSKVSTNAYRNIGQSKKIENNLFFLCSMPQILVDW